MRIHSKLFRQLLSFGAVGFLQIAIDWFTFVVLTLGSAPAAAANVVGRVVGAVLGYWLNGKWTFKTNGQSSLSRTALLRFIVTWLVTTAMSTLIVLIVDRAHGLHWAWLVKPVSDALLAAFGFTLSKFWVYRMPERPKLQL
jgi:putative flippase GtrA